MDKRIKSIVELTLNMCVMMGVTKAELIQGIKEYEADLPEIPIENAITDEPPFIPHRTHIDALGLLARTRNKLVCEGINTVADLLSLSIDQVSSIPGFGVASRLDLNKMLAKIGYSLSPYTKEELLYPKPNIDPTLKDMLIQALALVGLKEEYIPYLTKERLHNILMSAEVDKSKHHTIYAWVSAPPIIK